MLGLQLMHARSLTLTLRPPAPVAPRYALCLLSICCRTKEEARSGSVFQLLGRLFYKNREKHCSAFKINEHCLSSEELDAPTAPQTLMAYAQPTNSKSITSAPCAERGTAGTTFMDHPSLRGISTRQCFFRNMVRWPLPASG